MRFYLYKLVTSSAYVKIAACFNNLMAGKAVADRFDKNEFRFLVFCFDSQILVTFGYIE